MKVLKAKEVMALTGLSRVTIWRYELVGLFPKRVQIGLRRVGWIETEIMDWIQSRPRVGSSGKERGRE